MQTEDSGINYTISLSFSAIDRSKIAFNKKRDLIFSLYCFRGVFDNNLTRTINPFLTKYLISFVFPVDEPFFSEFKHEEETQLFDGGVGYIVEKGQPPRFKIDAGGSEFFKAVGAGLISEKGAAAIDFKTLYETLNEITLLDTATDEILAMWWQMFPYLALMETPHEIDLFEQFQPRLCNEKVYERVLQSRFSINIPNTVEEMWAMELPTLVIDWYLPYLDYINEKNEKGVTKQVSQLQRLLARGQFADVIMFADRLLNVYPDDENILLTYISARVSLAAKGNDKTKEQFLNETLAIIDDALTVKRARELYFVFYRGLTLLGLMQPQNAEIEFNKCLKIDPKFEMAIVMLRGIKSTISKKDE